MKDSRIIVTLLCLCCSGLQMTAQNDVYPIQANPKGASYREISTLFEHGMNVRMGELAFQAKEEDVHGDPEGLSVLAAVKMQTVNCERMMENYIGEYPYSVLIPQIRYAHGCNLFNKSEFDLAYEQFAAIDVKQLPKPMRTGYNFRKAYCLLEADDYAGAVALFSEVEKEPVNDFTAPARYALGSIAYENGDMEHAIMWFGQSAKDSRFKKVSNWYLLECHFVQKDYDYVIENAALMDVPEERRQMLARYVSESYLVKGDAGKAKQYYDEAAGEMKSRGDWFYSGSLLYATKNYRDAIESFSHIAERTDSIGQIANYQLGNCYIQTKNKVAALEAFKAASEQEYDPAITEDAYFNYAKLAFDINHDTAVFFDYLKKYPERRQGDRIYGYIAIAALYDRDYEAAVDAFDKIDELEDNMKANYMKANYLRANQLFSSGSYRKAVPCLKAAAYYAPSTGAFNQLSRYYLGEAYYRSGQYGQARKCFTELYNAAALRGHDESYLLPYDIAYSWFKQENYSEAVKWFDRYLSGKSLKFKKDAMERKADCYFASNDYKSAEKAYDAVLGEYLSANDIYPYYQSAVLAGLRKDTDKKIRLLSNVMKAEPGVAFYPEALFELGRTYELQEKDDKAFECFNRLIDTVKDSTYLARAYVEMGSVARNQSQFNDALGYYKTVVENFRNTGYAEDALLAIEAIYQTKNEPQKYFEYVESVGKGGEKSEDEKERMYFNAAEQIYLSENYAQALTVLEKYLNEYPKSANAYKAEFYMAESYRETGSAELARDYYSRVVEHGEGSFVELSMLNFSNLSYQLEHWEDAYGGYASLFGGAKFDSNRLAALIGMMRSAYKAHNWDNAIEAADRLTAEGSAAKALKVEAIYLKAKALMASSRRTEAFALFETLAKDTASDYGCEAAYILIVASYDEAKFDEVRDKVYAFSDSRPCSMYWLAKSFIVLGDSFAEQGELNQAKATFESVRDGYTPAEGGSDDVLEQINLRLGKINEMLK